MAKEHEALKHLFQQEFSKMVAVISKRFGLQHIEIAEDIVSETFLLATETWGIKGIPKNPTAWLYAVAKQKTLYHLEARIASWHCMKEDTKEKWEAILQLYNQLLLVNYSPSVALNRTFALYKANGQQAALIEAEKLKLENNHFYFLLLGELYKNIDNKKAKFNFQMAYSLAKTQTEKQGIQEKIDGLN